MYKYLFFDDVHLYRRENAVRDYGTPEPVRDAVYTDGVSSTVFSSGWVFKVEGGYRLLYFGIVGEKRRLPLLSAFGTDGIHFKPEDLTSVFGPRETINEIPGIDGETGAVIEDESAPAEERYKLLFCTADVDNIRLHNQLFVSPDLLHWTKCEGVCWGEHAETIADAVKRPDGGYLILCRPAWGVRMVGCKTTCDWKNYSPYELCVRADALDDTLNEIYGMKAVYYGGYYIGFPHVYGGYAQDMNAKYATGTMKCQLAYSLDGSHWQRSLRKPFLGDRIPEGDDDICAPMIWPSSVREAEDGSIYICASAALKEHGAAFAAEGQNGRIVFYRLRKDGFIRLVSEDKEKESVVATRENAWAGGEMHVNIKARRATAAIYISDNAGNSTWNMLGCCEPLAGFTHEDCRPFSGDSTDWVPQFSGGTLDSLKGKTVALEIRFTDGELYSISCDAAPLFNSEGERFRRLGLLPQYRA